MKNLYELITGLVEAKEGLRSHIKKINCDSRGGARLFNIATSKYQEAQREIDMIEQEYAIGIEDVANCMFKHTGINYRPVIFRETEKKIDGIYYTDRFVACYINQSNPYYFRPLKEVAISVEKYENVLNMLKQTKSIIFSTSETLDFETTTPAQYLNNVNFIAIFTRPSDYDEIISKDFIEYIKPMLKRDLKDTNIICNDQNFNKGI